MADAYGVQTAGNLHVGFKWIGAEIDARGPKEFVFGAEESYGFLAGDHVRDKDAAVASMLTAELAARLKAEGKTLYQRLDELFRQFGCCTEGQLNIQMPGEKGMDDMRALMARVRSNPPEILGGLKVVRIRDYLKPHGKGVRNRFAARCTQGGHGDSRPERPRKLPRRPPVRHGAEGEDLSVCL